MKPRGNNIDAMPLSSGGCRPGPNLLDWKIQIQKIQEEQEEHTIQCRDDAVDGEELMVPRVLSLPPEPSATQIAEHELTGHAVYRSWCRHCGASKGRAHADVSREEGELPEIGMDNGFFGRCREDVLPILCQMPKQFNWMLGSDSC